jgi:tripartite-type tricarboxylate transporter receptor subunit TctC
MIKNRITRRQCSLALASAAAAAISSELPSAQAQPHYPSRPVRFILPFGAAGVADITSAANDLAVRRALEAAGVEFIDENGGGPGVRLRERLKGKPRQK